MGILNPQRSFLCFIKLAVGNFYWKFLQAKSSALIKTKWFKTKQRQDSILVLCLVSLLCLLTQCIRRPQWWTKGKRRERKEETRHKISLRERRLRQKFREMDKIIVRKEHVIIIYPFGFQPESILCILEKSLSWHLKNDG